MATVHYEKRERVVLLTMEGDNDLNLGMVGAELHELLADYANDDELRCCIVTGAGERAFSAGANLKNAPEGRVGGVRSVWDPSTLTLINGLEIRKPIIAAVNGFAIGAGCMLALACDIRIASENAEFGIPEIKLGFPSGMGAPQRLPRLIPFGAALEMLLTGDRIKADQALQWGLVNRVRAPGGALGRGVRPRQPYRGQPSSGRAGHEGDRLQVPRDVLCRRHQDVGAPRVHRQEYGGR